MGLLYGRAGRLTALFGGFRPGQYDDGCRGVGGTVHVPCTSVGEENLLGIAIGGDPHFKDESILVHEFAHAVMNIGISGDFCFPDHDVLHNLRCKFIHRASCCFQIARATGFVWLMNLLMIVAASTTRAT